MSDMFLTSCPEQVPPLTPCSNTKVGEALRLTYSSWSLRSVERGIPDDPRRWSLDQVRKSQIKTKP